jgi:hypothetical protein
LGRKWSEREDLEQHPINSYTKSLGGIKGSLRISIISISEYRARRRSSRCCRTETGKRWHKILPQFAPIKVRSLTAGKTFGSSKFRDPKFKDVGCRGTWSRGTAGVTWEDPILHVEWIALWSRPNFASSAEEDKGSRTALSRRT